MSLKDRYRRTVDEDLRLTILLLLLEAGNYDLNIYILQSALADFGHRPSQDKLQTELSWLTEQGLCDLSDDAVVVAKLTQRGKDVAEGRQIVPGVKRPHP